MNAETRRWLEVGALQLAVVVAATHLYWGLPRLLRQPSYGVVVDPRPILFVLSAFAIFAGVVYVALGGRRAPVYALGIALLATFVAGYVWWHLSGHVGGLPWVDAQPTVYHDRGPVATIYEHLRTDRLELVSKAAETVLAAVLAVLLYDSRTASAEGTGADVAIGDAPASAAETAAARDEDATAPTTGDDA